MVIHDCLVVISRNGECLAQLDSLLALDMVSVAERGLGAVLADNQDLFRHTFRRGELYSAASSTRGVECQLLADALAPTSAPVSSLSSSSSSQRRHWTYGPTIYRHLQAVRISRIVLLSLTVKQYRKSKRGAVQARRVTLEGNRVEEFLGTKTFLEVQLLMLSCIS